MSKIIKNLKSPYKEIALSNQSKQGNKPNGELRLGESVKEGGFKWGDTEEGYDFWFKVFSDKSPKVTEQIKSYHPTVFSVVSN